jgi:hypothetical protein
MARETEVKKELATKSTKKHKKELEEASEVGQALLVSFFPFSFLCLVVLFAATCFLPPAMCSAVMLRDCLECEAMLIPHVGDSPVR